MQDDLNKAINLADRLQKAILTWLQQQGLKVSQSWTVRREFSWSRSRRNPVVRGLGSRGAETAHREQLMCPFL